MPLEQEAQEPPGGAEGARPVERAVRGRDEVGGSGHVRHVYHRRPVGHPHDFRHSVWPVHDVSFGDRFDVGVLVLRVIFGLFLAYHGLNKVKSGIAGTTTLSGPIDLTSGLTTFEVNTNAPLLRLTGAVGGSGSIAKTAAGTLEIASTSNYAGSTTISAGSLVVNGSS